MQVVTERLEVATKGSGDFKDLTVELEKILKKSKLDQGVLVVFAVGSTCGLTTFEFEPGLIEDMRLAYERLFSSQVHYHHDETWGDANGFSHLRAAFQGQSLVIPFEKGKLSLGTWQQVVLAEFDTRPRQRQIVVTLIGQT